MTPFHFSDFKSSDKDLIVVPLALLCKIMKGSFHYYDYRYPKGRFKVSYQISVTLLLTQIHSEYIAF